MRLGIGYFGFSFLFLFFYILNFNVWILQFLKKLECGDKAAEIRKEGANSKIVVVSSSFFFFLFFCGRWLRPRWSCLSLLSLASSLLLQWPPRGHALDPPLFAILTLLWRVLLAGTPSNGPRLRFPLFSRAFSFLFFRSVFFSWLDFVGWLFVCLQPFSRSVSLGNLECLLEAEQIVAEVRSCGECLNCCFLAYLLCRSSV